MEFPAQLYYTEEHEWIRVEGDIATVGITDFAQGELGDIVYLDIPTIGDELKQGEVFGSVEAVKTVSDLFMPVSGTVLEMNKSLDATPELVNTDAYNGGWMVRIQMSDASEVSSLLSAAAYAAKVG
jgi:glycine cleavage system H protein